MKNWIRDASGNWISLDQMQCLKTYESSRGQFWVNAYAEYYEEEEKNLKYYIIRMFETENEAQKYLDKLMESLK